MKDLCLNPKRFASHLAVYIVVKNDRNEILLHQRSEGSRYLAGHWDFPSGHVEAGEGIAVTAARELKEETDLATEPDNLKLIAIASDQTDFPYVNFLFLADRWEGVSRIIEPDKCDDMRWFPLGKLPSKCTPMVRIYEEKKFSNELSFHYMGEEEFTRLMGGQYDPETRSVIQSS